MSKLKGLLLTGIALLIALFSYLLAFDDAINPQIPPILEKYNSQYTTENNGSVYQLGMWASLDDSPYEVGLWRLNQYQAALAKQGGVIAELKYEDYPTSDWLKLPFPSDQRPELLCDFDRVECLTRIYDSSEKAAKLSRDNQAYIDRHDGLKAFNRFELYDKPSIALPQIHFGPGVDILKLKLMTLFGQVKAKEYKEASDELARLVTFYKRMLAQTPYLIADITAILELDVTLNTAAFLMAKTDENAMSDWSSLVSVLTQFEPEQLSLEKAIFSDVAGQVNALDEADLRHFVKEQGGWQQYLPIDVLYKRNRTINQLFEIMTANLGKAKFVGERIVIEPSTYVGRMLDVDLRNLVGSQVIISAPPKFTSFESELFDLAVKQDMLKHLMLNAINNETKTFKSPYTGKAASIKEHQLCITHYPANEKGICLAHFQLTSLTNNP